ncbi:MAG TPA: hypothetical protein VFR37_12710, partial [Longimicrobium sp.]|nr:hypothetical protein [Longimicrobium sp.]
GFVEEHPPTAPVTGEPRATAVAVAASGNTPVDPGSLVGPGGSDAYAINASGHVVGETQSLHV